MDRIILDIKDKLYDGDLLIYKDGKLTPISVDKITSDLYEKYNELVARLDLQSEQLQRVHDVIQLLLNGDEQ